MVGIEKTPTPGRQPVKERHLSPSLAKSSQPQQRHSSEGWNPFMKAGPQPPLGRRSSAEQKEFRLI